MMDKKNVTEALKNYVNDRVDYHFYKALRSAKTIEDLKNYTDTELETTRFALDVADAETSIQYLIRSSFQKRVEQYINNVQIK